MKIDKKGLKAMIKNEMTLIKENWDDVYDDPMEAELARVAYGTPEPDPGGEYIADAMGDEVIDAVHDMIKMDIEEYVSQGMSAEEATKKAKLDAAEILGIAARMIKERHMKSEAEGMKRLT